MPPSLPQFWGLLVTYLHPQWRKMMLLALLLFSGIGLQLVNPLILRSFIDTALVTHGFDAIALPALLFIGIALLTQVIAVAETYVSEDVGWSATNILRADLALHCLRLDLSFYKEHPAGELIERIDGDVTTLANVFSRFVLAVLGNLLLLFGMLVILWSIDWRAGIALTLFAGIVLLSLTRLQRVAVPRFIALRQASSNFFGFLEERLVGTEDIRSCGAIPSVMVQFYRLMRQLTARAMTAAFVSSLTWTTTVLLFALGVGIAFAFGAYLFSISALTIGTVYLIFTYAEQLRRPLEQITQQLQDLQRASAGLTRIHTLLQMPVTIHDGPGAPLPTGALPVEFDHVTFGYDPATPILHDLSFRVPSGKVLGVLGRTGAGKTTLTRLLFRLYDPMSGVIRLGDVDIRIDRLSDLRDRIGLVTQDVQLFDATVRENLTFFDDRISDDQILHALTALGLWDWYQALPHGLDTNLASAGLSAGEAQLLAFTRVFLKHPGLVLLDEATSRLDVATEQLVEQAITNLVSGRTTIIVAHRLATVQRADDILILEDGRIAEYGARADLANDPTSRYAELLQTGLAEVLA